jgi:predicted cupin superfamily sugar epimerase
MFSFEAAKDIGDWRQIVKLLDMQPHPEGGFYKETFRDAETSNHNASDSQNRDWSNNRFN